MKSLIALDGNKMNKNILRYAITLTIVVAVMAGVLYKVAPDYLDYRLNKDVYMVAKAQLNASREQVKLNLVLPQAQAKESPKQ